MNKENAIYSLTQVKNIFDKYNIDLVLTDGTLLGAIREKGFIPWDNEIDLFMWHTDLQKAKIACKELEEDFNIVFELKNLAPDINLSHGDCAIGISISCIENEKIVYYWTIANNIIGEILDYLIWLFKLHAMETKESRIPLKISLFLKCICKHIPRKLREVISDIIQLTFEKTGSFCLKKSIPIHFFNDLKTINFYNMKFKVPAKTEEYLVFRYGKDWHIPKRESPRDIGNWNKLLIFDSAVSECSKQDYFKAKYKLNKGNTYD